MRQKIVAALILVFFGLTCYAQSSKEFLKKGRQQYDDKNYEEALKTFKEGAQLHPKDAHLNFYTGLTYLSLPNRAESLRYLQTAFTLNPSVNANLYYYLGLSYQYNRQFEKAQEFFEEFKRRNKKLADQVDKKIRQSQFADSLTRMPTNAIVENVGKVINSSFHEYSPLVSLDGNTMVFTSNRPDSAVTDKSIELFEDIYISKKVNGEWTLPKKISPNINIQFNDAAASISADGKTLVLYYEYGGGDIYVSTRNGEEWTKPTPLNENINTPLFWETSAFLTADGQKLYFTSDKPGGMGNLDIYVSEMEETGDWGKANNLGPVINTPGREDSPALDPEGRTLYFSSDGHPSMGGTDIFRSEFKDGQWQKPVNMGYPINSVEDDNFFSLTGDRRKAYFSTLREEGNAEIYTITFIEPEQEIASVITPQLTAAPSTVRGSSTGTMTKPPKPSTSPALQGFDSTTPKKEEMSAGVIPRKTAVEPSSREFLFFAIGKDDLSDESMIKIINVYGILSQSPQMTTYIEGHTDNTGSDLLNQALSVKRANSVAKELTKMGLSPQRISLEAFGATRPLVSNDDERDGREINRRVEVKVQGSGPVARASE